MYRPVSPNKRKHSVEIGPQMWLQWPHYLQHEPVMALTRPLNTATGLPASQGDVFIEVLILFPQVTILSGPSRWLGIITLEGSTDGDRVIHPPESAMQGLDGSSHSVHPLPTDRRDKERSGSQRWLRAFV